MRFALLVSSALFISCVLLSPAFSQEAPTKAADKDDYIVLRIDGEAVSRSRVQAIWQDLFPAGKAPDFDSFDDKVRMNVLRGIVSEQLVYNEAKKSGLESSAEVAEKLAKLKEKLVTQAFLDQKATAKVSESEIRKVYEEKSKEFKGKDEIKARHILVDDEAKAKEIAKSIASGEKFEDIAKKESLDKASGARGGDLGWFTDERMVPDFSKAAFKLKKGEISKPIKTTFGWHIIQVEDRRPVKVPAYEDVKESIAQDLKGKALKTYISELLKGANVQYFAADGTEKPFSKDMPASTKE